MARRVTLEFQKRDVRLKDIPLFYKNLADNKITVGVHKREGMEVGSTDLPKKANTLEKAYWNEFGTTHTVTKTFRKRARTDNKLVTFKEGTIINVPPRPFVRLYLYPEKIQKIIREYNISLYNAFNYGLKKPVSDAKNVLKDVAYKAEKEMQETIRGNNTLLPNTAFTIYLKGFDYPLFETGKLLNAIKGKVEKA